MVMVTIAVTGLVAVMVTVTVMAAMRGGRTMDDGWGWYVSRVMVGEVNYVWACDSDWA